MNTLIQKDKCTPMFTAAKTLKQPKCPSAHQHIKDKEDIIYIYIYIYICICIYIYLCVVIYIKNTAAKLLQSCLTLCDTVGYSPPASSVHGILQARIVEWFAISYPRIGVLEL